MTLNKFSQQGRALSGLRDDIVSSRLHPRLGSISSFFWRVCDVFQALVMIAVMWSSLRSNWKTSVVRARVRFSPGTVGHLMSMVRRLRPKFGPMHIYADSGFDLQLCRRELLALDVYYSFLRSLLFEEPVISLMKEQMHLGCVFIRTSFG